MKKQIIFQANFILLKPKKILDHIIKKGLSKKFMDMKMILIMVLNMINIQLC